MRWPAAATLIGTTAVIKGDIDGAIRWFELQIKERGAAKDLPLIELYANLGSIYNKYRKDHAKALQMYEMALKAPRPGIYDEQAYAQLESSVNHDIAVVYWTLRDHAKAREYAEARLRIQPDCPDCQKIIEQLTRQEKLKLVNEVRHRAERAQIIHVRDRRGEPWVALRIVDGKEKPIGSKGGIVSSMLYCAVLGGLKLSLEEKTGFCYLGNLPAGDWGDEHYSTFAIGWTHWVANGAPGLSEVSPERAASMALVTEQFKKELLPEMPRPLDSKAGKFFSRLYGPNGSWK